MVKIGICGGSGYTGSELLRILSGHPHVEITVVTSEKSAGRSISEVFPHLHKYSNLIYEPLNKEEIVNKAEIFFMALPHGASQEAVNFFLKTGKKVIDLSADFRLKDPKIYENWYKIPHSFPEILNDAVYGLPELYREKIKKASLIANPGCYPTSVILGLYPAIKDALIDTDSIVIDSKSGTSGAGRKGEISFSYCEVNEGFKAYGIAVHRHTPEIEQELSIIAEKKVVVNFTPHLVPMDRGILSTMYARLIEKMDTKDVLSIYKKFYSDEPFINILQEGTYPNTKNVRGSNYCDIGIKVDKRTNTLIVISCIDNLVKGASGQAVQNMNIMMGFEETTALNSLALFP